MGDILWICLLCGLTFTLSSSFLSLFITNPETLLVPLWLGCISQSFFLGFHIYFRRNWITFVRIIVALPFSIGLVWLIGIVLKIAQPSLFSLFWLLGFIWFIMMLLWWGFSQKPKTFFHLLTAHPKDSTLSYEKWAAEEIARLNLNTSLEPTERLFFWTFFISLFFSGIAALVRPSMQNQLSIGWIIIFFGFWGTRAFLHEQAQIFGWRMQGLSTEQAPRTVPHALVVLLLALCLGVSFLLPHRFVLISLESLGEKFRESVRQTEIELQNQQQFHEETSIEKEKEVHDTQTSLPSPWIKTSMKIFGILLTLYLCFGLLGYLFERFFSYKPKNAFIQWFIRFYEKNKPIFQIVGFIFTLFWTIFSTVTGISLLHKVLTKRKETKTDNEAIKQQLYALFENAEATSDEKKEEIMTIVKYFVMLIENASSRILPYRPSYGPLEYIEKLTQNIPSLRESLLWIVSIFNESRYSLHLLSQEKRTTFAQTVETVIAEMSK